LKQIRSVSSVLVPLVLLVLAIVPSPAVAASSGGISGKVTAATGGAAIAGIEVCAFATTNVEAPPAASGGGTLPCATTGANGDYTITGLAAGVYEVEFMAPGGAALNYVSQFYPEADVYLEAEPVMVNGTSTRTGIDAALRSGSRLGGKVEDAVTEAGLAEVEVCAESTSGTYRCALTGADGTYAIAGLESGNYIVVFSPLNGNYVGQFYGGATYESAKAVSVGAAGSVTGIDAHLQRGATITGTVISAETRQPVEEVTVCAISLAG
jgi:Carboxypeptidase regulatory-like domain